MYFFGKLLKMLTVIESRTFLGEVQIKMLNNYTLIITFQYIGPMMNSNLLDGLIDRQLGTSCNSWQRNKFTLCIWQENVVHNGQTKIGRST